MKTLTSNQERVLEECCMSAANETTYTIQAAHRLGPAARDLEKRRLVTLVRRPGLGYTTLYEITLRSRVFAVRLEGVEKIVDTQRKAMEIFNAWDRGDTETFWLTPSGEIDVSHEIRHGLPLGDMGLDYIHPWGA